MNCRTTSGRTVTFVPRTFQRLDGTPFTPRVYQYGNDTFSVGSFPRLFISGDSKFVPFDEKCDGFSGEEALTDMAFVFVVAADLLLALKLARKNGQKVVLA